MQYKKQNKNLEKFKVHKDYSTTFGRGGGRMHLAHSEILLMASVAAARLGRVDVTAVTCCSVWSSGWGLTSTGTLVEISSGYSLLAGLLVCPVLVRISAARTRPSPPRIRFSTTASLHVDLALSLWISKTSPCLMDCSFVSVVRWNNRNHFYFCAVNFLFLLSVQTTVNAIHLE